MTTRLASGALAALLLCAALGAAGSAGAASFAPETPTNDTDVQHRNPETVDEDGDLMATQRWLADQLARRLGESSIRISQGQYARARELVDEDTRSLFDKYVDVAGETGAEDDTERFREARENQREYVDSVHRYRETYEEYREARRNGNETRARGLARELERISNNVSTTGRQLRGDYRNISGTTGTDLTEARVAVNTTTANVTERQAEIRAALFTRTDLELISVGRQVSFVDPLRVEGYLRAENGTAVADRDVTFAVGEKRVTAHTNTTGYFSFDYRPVRLPANATTLEIRYRPATAAPYLGSNATTPVSVSQVTPDVSASVSPGTAGYADRVVVAGRVAADGIGAGGVPLVVRAGGERLGVVRTNATGGYALSTALPATVDDGRRAVTVAVAMSDRAIAAARGRTPLSVERTATDLSVSASVENGTLVVSGNLTTADGRPVAGRRVRVHVGESRTRVARTDANGTYRLDARTLGGFRDDGAATTLPVRATFAERETNLGPANATTSVTIPAAPGQSAETGVLEDAIQWVERHPVLAGAIAAAVALALGMLGLWLVRRRESGGEADERPTEPTAAADEPSPEAGAPSVSLLDRARDRLAAGDLDEAVRLGYTSARTRLSGDPALTHWEFFGAARERLPGERRDALRTLVEAYERAAFAGGVDDEAAADAVEAASAVAAPADTDGGTTETRRD